MISRTVRVVVACVVLATLAAACSNAGSTASPTTTGDSSNSTTAGSPSSADYDKNVPVDAPGVSATEIKVGSITAKTNPLAVEIAPFNDGIKAYFDYMNSSGGIYGRKLVLSSERDDQLGDNLNQAQGLVSLDNVYAAFVATFLFSGAKVLAKAGIPTFGWSIDTAWYGPKNFFHNTGAASGCFYCLHPDLMYVMQQTKAKRLALLTYSEPASKDAAAAYEKTVQVFGPAIGAQLVYEDTSLSFGQTDFSAVVDELKKRNVDFIEAVMDFNGEFALIKEMDRQGVRDKIRFLHNTMFPEAFVAKNAKLLEGDYFLPHYTALEHLPNTAAQKLFVDTMKANDKTPSESAAQGWISAMQFVDALKATGPNFTRQNLISTWNRQTAYVADGWIPPIDWTKEHDPTVPPTERSPWACGNYVQVRDGKYFGVYDGGGAKPWVCFDNDPPATGWTEPVNVTFAGPPITYEQALAASGTTTTTTK